MRNVIKSVIIFMTVIFGAQELAAQKDQSNKNNYLVITQNTEQLKAIILTAKKLSKEDGDQYGEFHVVICGKAVQNLQDLDKMKPLMELSQEGNLHLFACGISLTKFNIDPSSLPEQFKVVENGIYYGFDMIKKGYHVLSL